MEYRVRFEKLCRRLDDQICEAIAQNEMNFKDYKKQNEKELLDAMEKAIDQGNLKDAMRYQFMLEILG
jgi:hypothetical protein